MELGAEFILPRNDTMLGYVERFGLGLWDKGMLYGVREPRGRHCVVPGSMHEALVRIGAALVDGAAGISAAALLDSLPLDPGASEAIRARLEVSAAATADRVAASALVGLAAHSDEMCPSVAGGNQRNAVPSRAIRANGTCPAAAAHRRVWRGAMYAHPHPFLTAWSNIRRFVRDRARATR